MQNFGTSATFLAIAIIVANCSSDKQSTQNGVASPTGGASSLEGTGGTNTDPNSTTDSGANDADTPKDAGTTFDGSCVTLPGKIVTIESGDTQENLLKNLGRHLRDSANITIAFNLAGSCTLTNDIFAGTKIVPDGTLKYIPSTAEDPEWSPSMAEPTCTTGPEGVSTDSRTS